MKERERGPFFMEHHLFINVVDAEEDQVGKLGGALSSL